MLQLLKGDRRMRRNSAMRIAGSLVCISILSWVWQVEFGAGTGDRGRHATESRISVAGSRTGVIQVPHQFDFSPWSQAKNPEMERFLKLLGRLMFVIES